MASISAFEFNSVAHTTFAVDSSLQLGDLCLRYGVQRPLLVTDKGIVACGLLTPVLDALDRQQCRYTLFDEVLADPPESNVLDAVAVGNAGRCDGVIGFGGGSSMDVAKLIAALMGSEQPLSEMYGVEMVTGSRLPLIQVPTTAGTGSEATAVAIVTTGETTKAGVVSPVLFADHIVLDPRLTLGLPPHVTAATGIDAMVHAIEAFTSKRLKNPLSDMVALRALDLLSRNIRTAVSQGSDIDARSEMLLGAMLAGQAFANAPVGAVHALAYPLGGTYHIPHGLSNSLVLPHVIRFNSPAAAPLYLEVAAAIFDIKEQALDIDKVSEVMADYFLNLALDLGLQTKLSEINIAEDALEDLAEKAMDQQRLLINNPRDVSYQDALAIYKQAY